MISGINTEALEKVKRTAKGIIARCPACAAEGEDNSGNNFFVGDRGFCCAKYKGDKAHSKRIFAILKNGGVISDEWYVKPETQEVIQCPKIWDKKLLEKLLPYDDYWNKRGVSSQTLRSFKSGFAPRGNFELSGRYLFPIFDNRDNISGWAGRICFATKEAELKEKGISKWKLKGNKKDWVYPYSSIPQIQETGKVYLVEGISDVVYLYEHGYKNCFALFGTEIMPGLLKQLIRLTSAKIMIALNNEESEVGNNAAEKIRQKLSFVFDEKRIQIKLPPKKDFALMSKLELEQYHGS